jgi:hypothetical protein
MLVIRIELWPLGNEQKKRELGLAHIVNDGSGTGDVGNYDVRLFKSPEYAKSAGTWKGRVDGFPRRRLGPWDLLFRALQSTVGTRR